jgi:monoamine oxidase
MDKPNVIIIGAGLAGLNLARLLKQEEIDATILEARQRIGGRIKTILHQGTTLELGATWFADKHQNLLALAQALSIPFEEQYYGKLGIYESELGQIQAFELPPQPERTYRFTQGSLSLIETLAEQLDDEQIALSKQVRKIIYDGQQMLVHTDKEVFSATYVVNTLPPHLAINGISYEPELAEEIRTLSSKTHTWMGESIKVGFFSPLPFWREKNIGTLYSQRGPITELYDHSNSKGFALKGFMHDSFVNLPFAEREKGARAQLANVFGEKNMLKCTYVDSAWRNESDTFLTYQSFVGPHQNNGNPLLREALYDGHLLLSSSETATHFPGYMDGAIEASIRTCSLLKEKILKVSN